MPAEDRGGELAPNVDELLNTPPPLLLQIDVGFEFLPTPPRPARGKRSRRRDCQLQRREHRLLKKASSESSPAPLHNHDGLTKPAADERLVLRQSTEPLDLQNTWKTALFKEMPLLSAFPSSRSYHRSCAAKTARTRKSQIRPMESGELPQYAKQSIYFLKLTLKLLSAPFHCQLQPATPARAAPVRPSGGGGRTKGGEL
jgi:hypothetical protein